ncbi:MAG: fibronectin type III domain-containing protein [Acidobacteria bacterium]|nr:fibronectin type III domain-containing protein [Acidobacteriota bacterium]
MSSVLALWNANTDYAADAVVLHEGVVYGAATANGPTTNDAINPSTSGQTTWVAQGGLFGGDNLTPSLLNPPGGGPAPSRFPLPMQVSGVRIEETDDGLVTVAWDANVDEYEVQWRTADQEFSDQRSKETADLRTILKGLTNGERHYVRVRAKNASMGDGAWSRVLIATPAKPPVPDTPEAPVASSARGGVTWSWTLPDDNGSPIIDFDLRWKERDAADWTLVEGVTNTSQTVEVADLAGRFLAEVRARNATGHSGWSPTSTLTGPLNAPLARLESLEHVFTAGETWTWPYADLDSALVVIRGGDGGDGGNGGQSGRSSYNSDGSFSENGSAGSAGSAGASGGASSVTADGTLYSASGGTAGTGGRGGSTGDGNLGALGTEGTPGETTFVRLTDLAPTTELVIAVGTKGAGGAGGVGGRGGYTGGEYFSYASSGATGAAGSDGSRDGDVRIYPTC